MEEEIGVNFEAHFRAFSTEEYERYCLMAMRAKGIGNGMSVVAW
jgi:hypothetical protein